MSQTQGTRVAPDRPLWIGITTRHGDEEWVQQNTRNYLAVVQGAGATPVVLSPDCPAVLPGGQMYAPDAQGRIGAAILGALDGLILSGGGDVHPRYFGQGMAGAETESIDTQRDELEIELAQAALLADLPLFGICRGCQVLNVAAGGRMIQHLGGHRTPEGGPTAFHAVQIEPQSRLHGIVSSASLPVNTFHHQGLDAESLAPIFAPAAMAVPDAWLVEAYESRGHAWVLGVQWHPERVFELDDGHGRIWASFFAACAARRSRRAGP
jgi:putative glutamine amidotransferase